MNWATFLTNFSNGLVLAFVGGIPVYAYWRKVPVYETFVEGAQEGFQITIKIIPYLVAMLVGIAVFRASGAMSYLTDGIGYLIGAFGFNTDFVQALA